MSGRWLCPKCANDGTCQDIFEAECHNFIESDKARKERLADEAVILTYHTPNGMGIDADTVLADIVQNTTYAITGSGQELLSLWQQSCDRKSVEAVFHLLTGVTFEEYLMRCIRDTSRPMTQHRFCIGIYSDPDELPLQIVVQVHEGVPKDDVRRRIVEMRDLCSRQTESLCVEDAFDHLMDEVIAYYPGGSWHKESVSDLHQKEDLWNMQYNLNTVSLNEKTWMYECPHCEAPVSKFQGEPARCCHSCHGPLYY